MSANETQNVFQEIQEGKNRRYAILNITDGEIKLDKIGGLESSQHEFFSNLHVKDDDDGGNEDCRYAIYNMCSSLVLLMFWCPDSAKTETKALYSSSVDALKKAVGMCMPVRRIKKFDDYVEEIKAIEELREKTLAEAAAKIGQSNTRAQVHVQAALNRTKPRESLL